MPSKKRNKFKRQPRKAAVVPPQRAPDDPISLLANPSDLRALEIFFTQTHGFRLALALHDDMRVRDRVNQYLQEKLKASSVDLRVVDLRTQSPDISLLGSAAAAFAAHKAQFNVLDTRAALVLVNLESRVNYNPELADAQDQKSAYLATTNLQRDLWPTTFEGPVLIWISELLEPAMAKWAPDFWHWRSHVFDFRMTQQEKGFGTPVDDWASSFDSNDETRVGAMRRLLVLQAQLSAYRKAGMRGDEARMLRAIGWERLQLDQVQLAKQDFEAGLAMAREIGDTKGQGDHLELLGRTSSFMGKNRDAIGFYEQALDISHVLSDQYEEMVILGNMANAWHALGERQKAINFYEQALAIAKKRGDKGAEGQTLGNLGVVWAELGESRRAIEFHERALLMAKKVGARKSEGQQLGNLGRIWGDLGESRRAIDFHEKALAIFSELGNKQRESISLGNLGYIYSGLNERRLALSYYEQALTIAREIGDRHSEGASLYHLAACLNAGGSTAEQQQATSFVREALVVLESLDSLQTSTLKTKLTEWLSEN